MCACRYTPAWQFHVLAHQPFYQILLPVFLDLMLATVDLSTDMVMRECHAVAQVRCTISNMPNAEGVKVCVKVCVTQQRPPRPAQH